MKTRKLLALVLAIAMIATIFVVPSAAVAPGAACEILGLLKGEGEGVTAEYLAKGTTRAQGLLITLRARGLEDEALAFTGTDTFTDAGDVPAFWAPILAYAYANPALGWVGDGDGTFRPADIMTGAELAKVMLALLGYEQGEDFEWDDIATFAESKGVTVPEGDATNDDLAASLVEALATETKEGGTLIDAMIETGVVTEEAALEAEVKETEPVVTTAFAVEVTGAKKVKAVFAEAQDKDTAIISLKKGAVGQAVIVEWDKDKKVATLTKSTAFTKGDYTLTINGEAVDFTIAADETATELVVGATSVYDKDGNQDIKLHLLNQYGEQMTFTGAQMVGGASKGVFTLDGNTAQLDVSDPNIKAGMAITLFAYYSPKNFSVNATITVLEDQKLASIVFNGPIEMGDDSKKLTRLTAGTAGNKLPFKALDQYGNTINLVGKDPATYSLVLSGADNPVVADIENGKLKLNNLKAGTFTARAIVMASGSVSEMYSETVYAAPKLASFDVTVPEALYQNEAADFAVAGVDQYGKAINVDDAGWNIFAMAAVGVTKVYATNKVNLKFDGKGTFDLHFTKNGVSGTVIKTVTVQAEKKVASIFSIPVSTQALLDGIAIDLDITKVKLHDQYGKEIAAYVAEWNWDLRRNVADGDPYGLATGTDEKVFKIVGMNIEAQKPGVEQLRLTYYHGADYATRDQEIIYDFPLSVVAASAVVAYEFDMADFMYAGYDAIPTPNPHDIGIKLIGKTANGTTVTMTASGETKLPDIIPQFTVTGTNVEVDRANSKLKLIDKVGADTTTTIKAWNNKGEVVAEKTVALKKAAPAKATVTMAYDKGTLKASVTAKDQYGVDIAAPAGKYYSSDAAIFTVDADSGQVTEVKAGTALVRFVSTDGVWAREISVTLD